ncbi:MAG: beta-lactamase family protein [Calditrichia bacterium]|nr:beta-lactamase family protein [Calditrichia bacterium]
MKKLTLFIFVLFLVTHCFSRDFPNTPAGQRAKEVVDLLNSSNSFDLEDYIKNQYAPDFRDAFPLAAHKAIFQTTETMFGTVKVVDIPKSTENEISIVLKAETKDAWLNLNLQVEPNDPHRIVSMGLGPGTRPDNMDSGEELEGEGKPRKEKAALFSNPEELHQYLLKKAEASEFSGVVLIAKGGEPLFQKAYGYASKRFDVPNKVSTKFNLGSINKIFTTVAITQLMEKGKLSIDDPIGKYLNTFPREIADKVTIRHLLNMRSGWGDYWGNEYYLSHRDRLRTVSDYMEFIKEMPLDFEPGANFQHSNTGYEVAGAIIEAVSGMDYFDFLKKNIFELSGMTNTDSYHRDGPVKDLAVGYTNMNRNDPEGKSYEWNNTYMLSPRGTPAGGGYSTGEDLLKFDQALRNNKLLNSAYTQYLISRFHGSLGDPFSPPKNVYRIVGGAPGISAYLGMDFQSSHTIIVLSNYDFPAAMEVAEEIIRMLGLE